MKCFNSKEQEEIIQQRYKGTDLFLNFEDMKLNPMVTNKRR